MATARFCLAISPQKAYLSPGGAAMKRISILTLAFLLVACNGDEDDVSARVTPNRPVGTVMSDTASGVVEGSYKAARQPFEDVGLAREEIPPLLIEVGKAPYRKPMPLTCVGLRGEIAALDAILGADVCTPENPSGAIAKTSRKGEYVDEGASYAKGQAVDTVSGYLNILPFRGAVRQLSGANKHAKAVARAYEIGKSRRAFLKGLAAQMEPECVIGTATPPKP